MLFLDRQVTLDASLDLPQVEATQPQFRGAVAGPPPGPISIATPNSVPCHTLAPLLGNIVQLDVDHTCRSWRQCCWDIAGIVILSMQIEIARAFTPVPMSVWISRSALARDRGRDPVLR